MDDDRYALTIDGADIRNAVILIAVASVIGIYLIFTTVLIAADGTLYIDQARRLAADPLGIARQHDPGYPLLILLTHYVVSLFTSRDSTALWILCAQGVSLVCRIAALIFFYFVGKGVVGRERSFWGVFILTVLPNSAMSGSNVLRDWPHMFCLALGLWLLLLAAERRKVWLWAAAGAVAGLGYLIRTECAQLVLYGLIWLTVYALRLQPRAKCQVVAPMVGLVSAFLVFSLPLMLVRGTPIPFKIRQLYRPEVPVSGAIPAAYSHHEPRPHCAGLAPGDLAEAVMVIGQRMNEHLRHFFTPLLLIGFFAGVGRQSQQVPAARFFLHALMIFNIIVLTALYCGFGYVSRRHCLPLLAACAFYIPIGMEKAGRWFDRWLPPGRRPRGPIPSSPQQGFFVLLTLGVVICGVRLARPSESRDRLYRQAATWLSSHTHAEDVIAVPDVRITFYADRRAVMHRGDRIAPGNTYMVKFWRDGDVPDPADEPRQHLALQRRWSSGRAVLAIYRVLPQPETVLSAQSGAGQSG